MKSPKFYMPKEEDINWTEVGIKAREEIGI
jgi:hypothetical protein